MYKGDIQNTALSSNKLQGMVHHAWNRSATTLWNKANFLLKQSYLSIYLDIISLHKICLYFYLSLDSANSKAVQGLQRIENSSDSLDVGMDEDVEAVEESSEETDFDTSDTVGVWTETEVKYHN